MISHQDARRNLSPGELIYANSMVAEEIALENKEKMSIGGKVGADITNKKTSCVQMDTPRDYSTNTRQQVAKMSGVGTGTITRYNRVMNSDNESKQRKVAVEYVKLCGYKHGEIGNGREKNSQLGNSKLSLDEIAKQLGTSKTNLERALSIERNLIHRLYAVSHKHTINRKKHIQKAIGAYQDNFGGF